MGKLAVGVMLAWAKVKKASVKVCMVTAPNGDRFPWLRENDKTYQEFKMDTMAEDANAGLKKLCQNFGTWRDPRMRLDHLQVMMMVHQDVRVVNTKLLEHFDGDKFPGILAQRPCNANEVVMQMEFIPFDIKPKGDIAWFPFQQLDRYADYVSHQGLLEPNGMWQSAAGNVVLIFDMAYYFSNHDYDLISSNVVLRCIMVSGSTKFGHFHPATVQFLPVAWDNDKMYLGPHEVVEGLYVVQNSLPSTQHASICLIDFY